MNQATLVGTVVESELKATADSQLLKMRLKTPTVFVRDDELKTVWDYHNIVYWGRGAEAMHRELGVGANVSVIGRITTRSYEKNGEKRYLTEINASAIAPVALVDERTSQAVV